MRFNSLEGLAVLLLTSPLLGAPLAPTSNQGSTPPSPFTAIEAEWKSEDLQSSIHNILSEALHAAATGTPLSRTFPKTSLTTPAWAAPKSISSVQFHRAHDSSETNLDHLLFGELPQGTPTFTIKNTATEFIDDTTFRTTTSITVTVSASESRYLKADFLWKLSPARPLNLLSFTPIFQERTRHSSVSLFEDRTQGLLSKLPSYSRQLNLSPEFFNRTLLNQEGRWFIGITVADIDNDGWDDLYVPQPRDLPNLLYLSRNQGTELVEAAAQLGLDFLDNTSSVIFVDLDNDGDQDAVLGLSQNLLVLENSENQFLPRFSTPQPDISALAVADFDLDGLLDIYVTNYHPKGTRSTDLAENLLYDSHSGAPNFLFRNTGDFAFEDVTSATGLDHDNDRLSFATLWEDLDLDGDPDLYIANDFGPNHYFENQGGRFVPRARDLNLDDSSTSMSVTTSDIDHNGAPDLLISNMFSTASRRIVPQSAFATHLAAGASIPLLDNLGAGNSLFLQRPSQPYLEAAKAAKLDNSLWSWGTLFADLNNDTFPDLISVNGFITGPKADDL